MTFAQDDEGMYSEVTYCLHKRVSNWPLVSLLVTMSSRQIMSFAVA